MGILSNLTVVIISQYIHIYQLITLCILKLHGMLNSVNLGKKPSSFCFTPTATALSQAPSTTFTGSENIYPLPARSSQLICQGFKLAFPHLSYLLQIYQQDNINKPPPKCNVRHILWLFTLFQALFWILRMKNYITDNTKGKWK